MLGEQGKKETLDTAHLTAPRQRRQVPAMPAPVFCLLQLPDGDGKKQERELVVGVKHPVSRYGYLKATEQGEKDEGLYTEGGKEKWESGERETEEGE